MFGKKAPIESLPEVNLNKIPDDFYGGNNPVIKFNTAQAEPALDSKPSVLSPVEKKLLDKQTKVGANNKLHPVNFIANFKFLALAFLAIILLVSLIGGAYYFWQYQKNKPKNIPSAPAVIGTQTGEQQQPIENVNNTPAPDITPPTSLGEAPLEMPSFFLGDSTDTDKDELTDPAEELFTTDATLPDSDSDKYLDSSEIYHLYNPTGKEPMKLVDSDLVSVYTNPIFGYKLYYPKSWAVGNVDTEHRDVLFSTFTGENIEVRVIPKDINENFLTWFTRVSPGENFSDYSPVESVFKQSGFGRRDKLVYFFPMDNQVIAIVYHASDSNIVNYRVVNQMFMRSFQFGQDSDLPTRVNEENPFASSTL